MANSADDSPLDPLFRHLEEQVDQMLATLPESVASQVAKEVQALRELLIDSRIPRFALLGRRGAGKSSLINALLGTPTAKVGHIRATQPSSTWETLEGSQGSLEILDTRGLNEGSVPEGADADSTPEDEIFNALQDTAPDAILLVVKSTEVDAGIDHDLKIVESLLDRITKHHQRPIPLTAVVTHADMVEPQHVHFAAQSSASDDGADEGDATKDPLEQAEFEESLREKLANLHAIVDQLKTKLAEYPTIQDRTTDVLTVESYIRWKKAPDGADRMAVDHRWGIGDLEAHLLERLPASATFRYARLSRVRDHQLHVANQWVSAFSSLALKARGGNVSDHLLVSSQSAMVLAIGLVAGHDVQDSETLRPLMLLRDATSTTPAATNPFRPLQWLTGASVLASGPFASMSTWAIGQAAIAYFIRGRTTEGALRVFEEAQSQRSP